MPPTGNVLNDTGYGIEFNSIPDSSHAGFGGIAAIPVLIDAKTQLDKEQVGRKLHIVNEFSTQAQELPFVTPSWAIGISQL
jgi:hypothetical protein